MRKNRIKRKVSAGGVALGAWLSFHSPELVEMSAYVGFDFVFLDGEHCGVGPRECLELVRAADASDVDAIVRVPRLDGPTLIGYLETGVTGIVVPHISGADDVRRFVDLAKYPPEGRRSVMYSSRAARFGLGHAPDEYLDVANRETMLIPLVEDLSGMRAAASIGATPGIDLVFLGEGDLAVDMGHARASDRSAVTAVVRRAQADLRAAGLRWGMSARDPDTAAALVEQGASWIITTTAALYARAARDLIDRVSKASPASETPTA